ncbi:MAG TPA: glycine cleavage system protein H [Gemmataceae bacterium]|nr:glycine cleavage system protein H [Gemmataceae bacterium]
MPDDLVFLMGKFEAHLPADLRYARNHTWCRHADGRLRFGFTSYAVRLMQDVYFLDWQVSEGDTVQQLQQIGHIETSKAVSDLFAPISGTITSFNTVLLDDPSAINVDKYGAGWLYEMEGDATATITVAEYHQYLAANWEKTQRLIKGKINEDT